MHTIKLLYFARLRERFGIDRETLRLPTEVATVAALLQHLVQRGGVWAEELAGERIFRVALDQEMVDAQHPLHDGAEVAIFPPVTGG